VTIPAGAKLLGVRLADGRLLAMMTDSPAQGDYCTLARCADGEDVALRVRPMRHANEVGFLAQTADDLRTALIGLPAGVATCIPMQSLGYGISYMLYPPTLATVHSTTVNHHIPGDAFVGQWANEIAGEEFQGVYQPEGINRTWQMRHINMLGTYPFLQTMPHHNFNGEAGNADLDLSGYCPPMTDGIWLHGDAEPLVMSRRWIEGPGPCHQAAYWQFVPQAPSMDLPMDIASDIQPFLNLKAWLDFPATPNRIRLNLRACFVIRAGTAMDFYWAPPIGLFFPQPPFPAMDCTHVFSGASGQGDCLALLPESDVASLGCHCICTAFEIATCAHILDFSVNALELGVEYPACETANARFLREAGIHGMESREWVVPWSHGTAPEDVTVERVLEAFGGTYFSSASQLVAEGFSWFFGGVSGDALTIDNLSNAGRLDTDIEAQVTIGTPPITLPDEIAGTVPLPTSPTSVCFPGGPDEPTIAKVRISSAAAYGRMLENLWAYLISYYDVYAASYGVDEYGWPIGNPDLPVCLGLGGSTGGAYRWACHALAQWQNVEGTLLPGLLGHEFTNLPLRTDCFPGGGGVPPGFDAETNEWVFGWGGPGVSLSSDCDPYGNIETDIAGYDVGPTALCNPYYGSHVEHWRMIARGGKVCACARYSVAFCGVFPSDPRCLDGPPDPDLTCEFISEGPPGWSEGGNPGLYHTGTWPIYYGLTHPHLEVRLKLDGCQVGVRVVYLDWILRADTCYHFPEEVYSAELEPDSFPLICSLRRFEVGRGGQVYIPSGWQEEGEMFGADGVLQKWVWTRMIATDRSLGGCLAANPGRSVVCGRGNAVEVYF